MKDTDEPPRCSLKGPKRQELLCLGTGVATLPRGSVFTYLGSAKAVSQDRLK